MYLNLYIRLVKVVETNFFVVERLHSLCTYDQFFLDLVVACFPLLELPVVFKLVRDKVCYVSIDCRVPKQKILIARRI
jgi:hypothetical protein